MPQDAVRSESLRKRSFVHVFLKDERLLQHLSPLGWEHINLTGDYVWRQNRKVERGKFRPLRPFPPA
jgi:Tn3 transposase DDE domain